MATHVTTQDLCKASGIKVKDFLPALIKYDLVKKDEDIKGYMPTRVGVEELNLKMRFNEDYQTASVLFDVDNEMLVKFLKAFKNKEAIVKRNSLIEYLRESGVNIESKRVTIQGVNYLKSGDQVLLTILSNMGYLILDDDGNDYTVKADAAKEWGFYKNSDTETQELWIEYKDKSFSKLFKSVYMSGQKVHDVEKIDKVFKNYYYPKLSQKVKDFVDNNSDGYMYIYKSLCAQRIITRSYVDSLLRFRSESDAKKNYGGFIDGDGMRFDYRIYAALIAGVKEIAE